MVNMAMAIMEEVVVEAAAEEDMVTDITKIRNRLCKAEETEPSHLVNDKYYFVCSTTIIVPTIFKRQ